MEVNIIDDTSYELSEVFQSGKEKLFKSFLDAEILKKIWFIKNITLDVRVEGKSFAEAEYNGENRNFILTYKEIVPYEKLSWVVNYQYVIKNETKNMLLFKKIENGTLVTLRSENFGSVEDRDIHMSAWKWALKNLGEMLKQTSPVRQ